MTSFDNCGKSPGYVTILGFSGDFPWINLPQLILFWIVRSPGGPVHIPCALVDPPALFCFVVALVHFSGMSLSCIQFGQHSQILIFEAVSQSCGWMCYTQPHETISGEEKRRCSKKMCESGGGHTLELQRKPSAFSESDNIPNPDDLVTEEGTQGPDKK